MGVDDLFWEVWAEDENLTWVMVKDELEEEKADELMEKLYEKRKISYWKRPYFVDD